MKDPHLLLHKVLGIVMSHNLSLSRMETNKSAVQTTDCLHDLVLNIAGETSKDNLEETIRELYHVSD